MILTPITILIPASSFWMGSKPGENIPPWELPQHKVELPAYRIGKYPVTNEQYLEFVKQTGTPVSSETGWKLAKVGKAPPHERRKHPVVGVNWDEAQSYCRWLREQTGRRSPPWARKRTHTDRRRRRGTGRGMPLVVGRDARSRNAGAGHLR